ncbi:chorismate mutase [Bacillus massiliglaciei]|uniref:chorismate mutase n=1 Tax=Bacillus massiliglaciei TaxID=1816693 RepID=UPI000B1DBA20|nr:chorismate mutase [Bacillus massiliglaciei]
MIRGIRGATTVTADTEAEIIQAAEALMQDLIESNGIEADMVASVFFSTTEDIQAAFPAKALRNIDGWTYVPVMCMKEIPVAGALKSCIRVMVHVNTEKSQQDIQHIYHGNAVRLRPDLQND